MSRTSRLEIIQNLRERLHQFEPARQPERRPHVPAGSLLDQLMPANGWSAGTLIEWLSDGAGCGAATLALSVAASLLRQGGSAVVIDDRREFYPPAMAGLGVPLERTVFVHPQGADDALWALEQTLRSHAVSVVIGWIGPANNRILRRLQLAAEAGGSFGFLLRPARCRRDPSPAEVRLWVETSASPRQPSEWRLRASVLHRRGGAAGETFEVELRYEENFMCLAASLGRAALPPRATGA